MCVQCVRAVTVVLQILRLNFSELSSWNADPDTARTFLPGLRMVRWVSLSLMTQQEQLATKSTANTRAFSHDSNGVEGRMATPGAVSTGDWSSYG
jgi:hypothetical protein